MAKGSKFEEAMKVARLLSAMMEKDNFAPTIASSDTISENTATYSFGNAIFLEEENRQKSIFEKTNEIWSSDDNSHVATVTKRTDSKESDLPYRESELSIRCYKCNKTGHFTRDCDRSERGRMDMNGEFCVLGKKDELNYMYKGVSNRKMTLLRTE